MNIALTFNHAYVRYAVVLLTSLYVNNADSSANVYVLHRDLTERDMRMLEQLAETYRQKIFFRKADLSEYGTLLPTTETWSLEMYYRLLLGELLPPEVGRVLYLDTDVIVNGALEEFYGTDFGEMELAAADDVMIQGNFSERQKRMFGEKKDVRYFNSGVLLLNLEKMRGKYTFRDYMRAAAEQNYELTNPDQDLLNLVHYGKVLYVDNSKYNVFPQCAVMNGVSAETLRREAVILHYAGRKPWNSNGLHYEAERIWWEYAKMTPFYRELMERVFLADLADTSYQAKMALLMENAELKRNLSEALALCRKLLAMRGEEKENAGNQ